MVCPATWAGRTRRDPARHPSLPEPGGGWPRTGILDGVNGRWVVAGLIWAAVSVLAFYGIGNVIVAGGLVVFGLVLLVVLAMASDWDRHPDFEERERARAQRRREKWERNAGARARDRERWEAHQARKAARGASQDR